MLFSLFTPTHNPNYLLEAYQSLCEQSIEDWEWVIVPNGGCSALPDEITKDKRVRIVSLPQEIDNGVIGALKHFACNACTGEYLIELDHDDYLTPDALEQFAAVIESESRPEFIFSDFVEFQVDGSSRVYSEDFSWENYPFSLKGKQYNAMRAFEPTAASLHKIFFAPNHVRVWRKDFYLQIGGHNAEMAVCDDQDLVIRSYLAGARMVHIPKVLYMYRLLEGKGNTFLERNKTIQERQQQVANQYIYPLIREQCRRDERLMVDLGGRLGCPEGYKSIDLFDGDIVANLRRGLPFKDSSLGCVRAFDFLEHIPHCADSSCTHGAKGEPLCTVGLMNEIYRVLVPGGWLISRTPSTDGRGAFQDPTHCSFWNPNSFWYYTRREQAQYLAGVTCRFQGTRIWQAYPSDWHKDNEILYVYADLVALKGQRQPGLQEI